MAPPSDQKYHLAAELAGLLPELSSDWPKIVEYSGLPPEARFDIERAILHYRSGKRALHPAASAMRNEIAEVANRAEALAGDLARLSSLPRAVVYLTLGLVSNQEFQRALGDGRTRARLEKQCADLRQLTEWMRAARARIAGSSRGAHEMSGLLKIFVSELDEIRFRHTGQRIVRSRKRDTSREYITTVCKIADPAIKKYAIEEAMKTVIKTRRKKS